MSIITDRRLNLFFQEIKEVFARKTEISAGSILSKLSKISSSIDTSSTNDASGQIVGRNYNNSWQYFSWEDLYRWILEKLSSKFSTFISKTDYSYGGWVISIGSGNEVSCGPAGPLLMIGNNNSIYDGSQDYVYLFGNGNKSVGSNNYLFGTGLSVGARIPILGTGTYSDSSKFNSSNTIGTSDATAFFIGNGSSDNAVSNAIRMDYNGKLWCKSAYSSSGADYAELFEWEDGNLNNENRIGYFVTMVGKKIKKASTGDYILGIVSAQPAVLGNSDMEWQGQFLKDEFGAFIIEQHQDTKIELQAILDEDGNKIIDEETGEVKLQEVEVPIEYDFYKVNPDYDPNEEYIDRLSRPEWDAIGMMGVLSVYDDGSCQVNGFCSCNDDGIATSSSYGYRVIERVSDNIIRVVISTDMYTMAKSFMNKVSTLEDRVTLLEKQIQELLSK